MKGLIFFLICFVSLLVKTNAQFQTLRWDWFEELDSTGFQVVNDIALDKVNGYVYAVGGFNSSLSTNFGGETSYGGRDGFVSKFDTLGNLQWSFHIGGKYDDEIMAIDIDRENDHILITGYCEDTSNFEGTSIGSYTNIFSEGYEDNSGNQIITNKDVFIASYNFQGVLENRQREGGLGDDIGRDIMYVPRGGDFNISRFVYTGEFYSQMELMSNGIDVGPNDNKTHMFVSSRFLRDVNIPYIVNIDKYDPDWRAYSEGEFQIGLGLTRNGEELHLSGNYSGMSRIRVRDFDEGSVSPLITAPSNPLGNIYNLTMNIINGNPKRIFVINSPGANNFGASNVSSNKLYIGGAVSDGVVYGNSSTDNGVVGQEAFVSIHDLNNNEAFISRIREPNVGASSRSIVHSIDFTDSTLVIGGRTNGIIRFDNNSVNDIIDQGNNTEGFVALYNSDTIFCERHEIDGDGTNGVNAVKGRGKDVFVGGAFGRSAKLGSNLVMHSPSDDRAGFISLLTHRDCKPKITYSSNVVCNESPSFLPNFIEDTIGYFSQVGSGLNLDSLTGEVNPFLSTSGLHQIIYTTFKGCSDTFDLTINLGLVPNFGPIPNDTVIYTNVGSCGAVFNYDMSNYFTQDCGLDTVNKVKGIESGMIFPIGVTELEFVLSDGYNQNDTANFKVTVIDNIVPTISCPTDSIIYYSSTNECEALVNINITANDNCTSQPTISQSGGNSSYTNGSMFPVSNTPYNLSFIATDSSGNISSSCPVKVYVLDTIKPEIKNCIQGDTIIYTSAISCSTEVNLGLLNVNDSCGIASKILSLNGINVPSLINTFVIDTTAAIFTVTDNYNNTSNCQFNIIVKDTIKPVFTNCTSGDTVKYYVGSNSCSEKVEFVLPGATDNCDFRIYQDAGFSSGAILQLGSETVVFKVEDSSGNFSVCNRVYSVIDTIIPVLVCPNDTLLNADIQTCGAEFIYSSFTGIDNCSLASSFANQIDGTGFSSGSIFPLGTTTLIYEQYDISGNSDACSFDVTVVNNETIDFINIPEGVCNDSSPFDLMQYISGSNQGNFIGNGVYNNVFYPDSIQGSSNISYTIGQGNCIDSINHTISVYNFTPNAGDSVIICGLEVVLDANSITGINGEWLQINNESYSPIYTDANATVSEVTEGDYYYVWNLSKDQCIKKDTVYVSFFEPPYSNAGENVTVDINEVILEAEQTVGNGYWTVLNSEGILEDSLYYNTSVSGLNLGLNTFIWSVTNGPCPSDSSIVRVFYDKLSLPNAFTPNGDGINDVFKIEGFELYSDAKLTILDRWGELIFFTEESDEYWDGTYKGKAVVEDTYFYILFINGEEYTGYIELRR